MLNSSRSGFIQLMLSLNQSRFQLYHPQSQVFNGCNKNNALV
ncbi:unnamed protein product [Tenebrio molitor]|nr:unnamed protein product [Tenebrio molitor]